MNFVKEEEKRFDRILLSFGKKYEDNFSFDIFKEIKIATVAKEPSSRGSFFVLCKLSKREPVDIIIESRGKKKKICQYVEMSIISLDFKLYTR